MHLPPCTLPKNNSWWIRICVQYGALIIYGTHKCLLTFQRQKAIMNRMNRCCIVNWKKICRTYTNASNIDTLIHIWRHSKCCKRTYTCIKNGIEANEWHFNVFLAQALWARLMCLTFEKKTEQKTIRRLSPNVKQ